MALLSEPWNKTVFGIVKESLKPMLTRDINCRKECKNADGVQKWVVDQSISSNSYRIFNLRVAMSSGAFFVKKYQKFSQIGHF